MAAEEPPCSQQICPHSPAQSSVIPQWEWCLRTEGNLDDLPNNAWGIYDEEMNERIEHGWTQQHAKADIVVGIRSFEIIFDGSRIRGRRGVVQYDAAAQKCRQVRRRLVSAEERAAALHEAMQRNCDRRLTEQICPICRQTFDASPVLETVTPTCGHALHSACAQRLADSRQPCPLCRREVDWADAGLSPPPRSPPPRSRSQQGPWTWLWLIETRIRSAVAGERAAGHPDTDGTQPADSERRESSDTPTAASASQGPPGNAPGVHPGDDPGLWMLLRAQQGSVDEVENFIRDGVNVDHRSPRGATALMSAAEGGHVDTVRFLLRAGADIRIETNSGYSAYHLALARRHREIVQMLVAHAHGGA